MTNTRKTAKQYKTAIRKGPAAGSASKKRRLGGRSQRVQESVFAAAIDVLLDNGFEGFRVADVAVRAGVNETSIYRRWGSRERLLIEALLGRVAVDLAIPNKGSLRSDLVAFMHELLSFLRSPVGIALLQFGAISINRPEFSSYRQKFWMTRLARIQVIFERAIERGEIPAGVDVSLMLELLVGSIYARMIITGQPPSREMAERSVDIVLGNTAAQA